MPRTLKQQKPVGDLWAAGFAALAVFISVTWAFTYIGLHTEHYRIEPGFHTIIAHYIPQFGAWFSWHVYPWDIMLSVIAWSSIIIATIATLATALYIYRVTTPPAVIHLAGRHLLTDSLALRTAQKDMAAEHAWGLHGLPLITTPGGDTIDISEDRETRHTLYVGSSGGGKTTILNRVINRAMSRGDRIIALDNKSDLTETLPGTFGNDLILLAPWDSRGFAWNVAGDYSNRADAHELSVALIPESKDPMWSSASRQVLAGMIIRAQTEAPAAWGFGFLAEILRGGMPEIRASIQKYLPEAFPLISDPGSKTTQSIFVNHLAYMRPVLDLADAWSRCPVPGSISIKEFLHGETTAKTMIVQGSGQYALLQKTVTQSIYRAMIREITSPRISDVRPNERRISLFADELPQFGKIADFGRLIEIGRSKGVRLHIGVQDLAQLREIYGRNAIETWTSSIGTYVICRLQGQETPAWISKILGDERVKIYSPSYSSGYEQSYSRTDSYHETDRPIVRPDELARTLGPDAAGVRVILHTGGDHIYRVHAAHLPKHPIRPATEPARWTEPGWPALISEIAEDNEIDPAAIQEVIDEQGIEQ